MKQTKEPPTEPTECDIPRILKVEYIEDNKAVYTITPFVGGWAGAVISMKYSYLNFSTFK